MIEHRLTNEEIRLAKRIAYDRNQNKVESGVQSGKVDPKQTESEIEVVGVAGEVVVAHELGMKINQEIYHLGDEGWDVRLGEVTAEVKTRRGKNKDFAMYDASTDLDAMVGVLCWQSGRTYTIVGWITEQDWANSSEILRFGSKRRKGVRHSNMRNPRELRSRLGVYAQRVK